MNPHIKRAWQCDLCAFIYEDEEDAIDCCRPGITERYLCPICKDDHDVEDAAIACCDFDPDGPPPPPSPAELEAAGQTRLPF